MVDCLVEFDYDAEQEDELTIKVGEIIKNVKMEEGGWWEGELNGKKGLFPDNFVKVIEKKQNEKVEKKEEPKKETAVKGQQRASVKDLANKLKDVHIGTAPQKKKESPSGKKKMAKVVYSYDPENEDELKLEVGDIVEVLKQEEEGWWEGSLNGKVGVFPSNFVELIEDSSVETEKTDTTPEEKSKDVHEVKGKKVIGVGLGNIFGDGPIKLRTTTGSKKDQPPPEPEEPPVLRKDKPPAIPVRPALRAKKHPTNQDDGIQAHYVYQPSNEQTGKSVNDNELTNIDLDSNILVHAYDIDSNDADMEFLHDILHIDTLKEGVSAKRLPSEDVDTDVSNVVVNDIICSGHLGDLLDTSDLSSFDVSLDGRALQSGEPCQPDAMYEFQDVDAFNMTKGVKDPRVMTLEQELLMSDISLFTTKKSETPHSVYPDIANTNNNHVHYSDDDDDIENLDDYNCDLAEFENCLANSLDYANHMERNGNCKVTESILPTHEEQNDDSLKENIDPARSYNKKPENSKKNVKQRKSILKKIRDFELFGKKKKSDVGVHVCTQVPHGMDSSQADVKPLFEDTERKVPPKLHFQSKSTPALGNVKAAADIMSDSFRKPFRPLAVDNLNNLKLNELPYVEQKNESEISPRSVEIVDLKESGNSDIANVGNTEGSRTRDSYLKSLNRTGNLPPFIKLIASRYHLFDDVDGQWKKMTFEHSENSDQTKSDDTGHSSLSQHIKYMSQDDENQESNQEGYVSFLFDNGEYDEDSVDDKEDECKPTEVRHPKLGIKAVLQSPDKKAKVSNHKTVVSLTENQLINNFINHLLKQVIEDIDAESNQSGQKQKSYLNKDTNDKFLQISEGHFENSNLENSDTTSCDSKHVFNDNKGRYFPPLSYDNTESSSPYIVSRISTTSVNDKLQEGDHSCDKTKDHKDSYVCLDSYLDCSGLSDNFVEYQYEGNQTEDYDTPDQSTSELMNLQHGQSSVKACNVLLTNKNIKDGPWVSPLPSKIKVARLVPDAPYRHPSQDSMTDFYSPDYSYDSFIESQKYIPLPPSRLSAVGTQTPCQSDRDSYRLSDAIQTSYMGSFQVETRDAATSPIQELLNMDSSMVETIQSLDTSAMMSPAKVKTKPRYSSSPITKPLAAEDLNKSDFKSDLGVSPVKVDLVNKSFYDSVESEGKVTENNDVKVFEKQYMFTHSRGSLRSQRSLVLNADPDFIRSCTEKRKKRAVWKSLFRHNDENPVVLLSYKRLDDTIPEPVMHSDDTSVKGKTKFRKLPKSECNISQNNTAIPKTSKMAENILNLDDYEYKVEKNFEREATVGNKKWEIMATHGDQISTNPSIDVRNTPILKLSQSDMNLNTVSVFFNQNESCQDLENMVSSKVSDWSTETNISKETADVHDLESFIERNNVTANHDRDTEGHTENSSQCDAYSLGDIEVELHESDSKTLIEQILNLSPHKSVQERISDFEKVSHERSEEEISQGSLDKVDIAEWQQFFESTDYNNKDFDDLEIDMGISPDSPSLLASLAQNVRNLNLTATPNSSEMEDQGHMNTFLEEALKPIDDLLLEGTESEESLNGSDEEQGNFVLDGSCKRFDDRYPSFTHNSVSFDNSNEIDNTLHDEIEDASSPATKSPPECKQNIQIMNNVNEDENQSKENINLVEQGKSMDESYDRTKSERYPSYLCSSFVTEDNDPDTSVSQEYENMSDDDIEEEEKSLLLFSPDNSFSQNVRDGNYCTPNFTRDNSTCEQEDNLSYYFSVDHSMESGVDVSVEYRGLSVSALSGSSQNESSEIEV